MCAYVWKLLSSFRLHVFSQAIYSIFCLSIRGIFKNHSEEQNVLLWLWLRLCMLREKLQLLSDDEASVECCFCTKVVAVFFIAWCAVSYHWWKCVGRVAGCCKPEENASMKCPIEYQGRKNMSSGSWDLICPPGRDVGFTCINCYKYLPRKKGPSFQGLLFCVSNIVSTRSGI